MGKTPGKWIKTFLLGKKSSNSSLSKGAEKLKSAKKEEHAVALKDTLSNVSVGPPSVSPLVPVTSTQNVPGPDKVVSENLPNDGVNLSAAKENEGDVVNMNLESQNELGKIKQEQAATKVQAAFRGHRERRAFRTLKGIIRLQAVIRGHLVRRQAVATFSCIWGIVKVQALVRGQRVRCSEIGIEIQKRHLDATNAESSRVSTYCWMQSPSKYAIVKKLLASSPTSLPLRLQYGPGEPNSALDWLECWTRLQIWAPHSQEAKNLISEPETKKDNSKTVETEKGRTKRSIKKPASAKGENKSSSHSTSESEKFKRNTRKVSVNPVGSSKEHHKPVIDNAKQNLKKTPNFSKDASDEKLRPSLRKASSSSLSDVPEKATSKSAEKRKDMADTATEESGLETDKKLPVVVNPEQDELQTAENNGLPAANNGNIVNIQVTDPESHSENDNGESESTEASERRASLPAKIDHRDDGVVHSTRKVPSYMAPTESAKARVRGQGSPRFSQDGAEKNTIIRRHSLPSSANGKLSAMSPRAQRLVLTSGKALINNDKSLSSSRDASDKTVRAEWKR